MEQPLQPTETYPAQSKEQAKIPVITVSLEKYIQSEIRLQNKNHCWAFSIACAIEIMHNKLKKNERDQRALSPQDMINCVPTSPKDESVANFHTVQKWLRDTDKKTANGVCQERFAKYRGQKVEISNSRSYEAKVQVDDFIILDTVDEDMIIQLLESLVPVVVMMTATDELKQLKADEIYKGAKNRDDENDETKKHAVLVVGYGENAYGQKCFLVRNSWEESWGKKGYGWVQAGKNLFKDMAHPIKEK